MAFWPFRRKRKEVRSAKEQMEDDLDLGISTHISGPIDNKNQRKTSRQGSKPNTQPEQKSRARSQAAASPAKPIDPLAHQAAPKVQPFGARETPSREAREPLAELQQEAIAPPQAPFKHDRHEASQNSLQPEEFTAIPLPRLTPRKTRTAPDVARVKSSKRKAEDKHREQEIRAMSTPIPIPKRPRSFTFNSPLAQDSKQHRNGLNRHFERPTSQVSLPVPESLRSSISGAPDMSGSFRISAFGSLSPRPTIRHADNMNRFSEMPSRASTRKDKNPVIPEEPFSPRARIDELAEDMDASTIRKLMERDGRRAQLKKKSDTEKLEKRLQRRLEKEKAAQEAEAAGGHEKVDDTKMHEADKPSTPDVERDPASPLEESSSQAAKRQGRPPPPQSPSSWLQDQSSESGREDHEYASPPLDSALGSEGPTPVVELAQTAIRLEPRMKEEPVIETARTAVRMSPPAFERSSRSALPPLVIERSYKPKTESGVPQRTKSKFKEDLPDFRDSPVSPLSPYIDNPSKVGTMTDEEVVVTPLEDVHPLFRDEVVARAP